MPSRPIATSGPLTCSNRCESTVDAADEPGSGEVAHRAPVGLIRAGGGRLQALVGLLAASPLIAGWLIARPRTPDLAGQVYRVGLFERLPFAIWDERWYAGHALPGYSLLFPPLGALVGVRVLGTLAVMASVVAFDAIVRGRHGSRARWATVAFAATAACDLWIGRVAFALGVSLAVGAVLAFERRRAGLAAGLSVLCAAASPVAGALLGLLALTLSLARRSGRPLLALTAPAAVLVGILAALFPEGGWEPYPFGSFLATIGVLAAFLWALPAGERGLRLAAALYLLVCGLSLVVHTPMGSNVERYGVLLGGPMLALAAARGGRRAEAPRSGGPNPGSRRLLVEARRALRPGGWLALAVAGGAWAVWVAWGAVRETGAGWGSPATSAGYYRPLERFLAGREAVEGPVRVEVPLTRSHWEAALLAPRVSLARGWEKQLETRYDEVLLRSGLTAYGYRGWLLQQAVGYVALPDVPLDPSSAQEGRLIRRGPGYLQPVFRAEHWRVFRVLGAPSLLTGPGRLLAVDGDGFKLRASAAGRFAVRVRFTRYWEASTAGACVARAPGGWTAVRMSHPGETTVTARFSLGRALGDGGGSCGR